MTSTSPLVPAFLKLAGRAVLLVGGGKVAASKLPALLEAGARVTVVSPEIGHDLLRPGVRLLQRGFLPVDLDGKWFAVAAAPPEVNREVSAAAEQRGIFVNAVDDAASASAYLGGVVRRGSVTLAISTDGRAPALAGLLREALDAMLPADVADWADLAERLRDGWRSAGVPFGDRRPLLLHALQQLYSRRGAA